MNPFQFYCVPRVVVERGGVRRLGEFCGVLGRQVLLVHNADAAIPAAIAGLRAGGVTASLFRVRGEPAVEDVDAALAQFRSSGCDCLIGLGGGSAIDLAKAVAAVAANGGAALDYMEVVGRGQKIEREPLPWLAVPTTAGTGAEATRNAVIADKSRQFKASIRSEKMLAKLVLIDAELGQSVRPAVTAASGCDALCQAVESYTSRNANPLTDGMALEAVRLAQWALPRAFANGSDLEAREAMAMAALLSGITLSNAGLGAVHGFAAPLGANFPVPHGVVCAALLPHVINANVRALRRSQGDAAQAALRRYATVCRALAPDQGGSDNEVIDAGTAWIKQLTRDLAIPPLRSFGLEPSLVPAMVELAQKASSMRYNPVTLTAQELQEVLREAI